MESGNKAQRWIFNMKIELITRGWSETRIMKALQTIEANIPNVLWANGNKPYTEAPQAVLELVRAGRCEYLVAYCDPQKKISISLYYGETQSGSYRPRIKTTSMDLWTLYINVKMVKKRKALIWNKGIRCRRATN